MADQAYETDDRRLGRVTANYPWTRRRVRSALLNAGMGFVEHRTLWGSTFAVTGTRHQWDRLAWALGHAQHLETETRSG